MFGATASAYGFNRIAKALQHLAVHYLSLLTNQFFDDYPNCEFSQTSASARQSFEGLLGILGWEWATGDKAPDFADCFNALGNTYDVRNVVKTGSFFVGNKQSRLDGIASMIDEALTSRSLRPSVAAELAGKLQYTSAQVFGDSMRPALRQIRNRADNKINSLDVGRDLLFALSFIKDYLFTAPPRVVSVELVTPPIFVFTDGSSEATLHLWGVNVFEAGVKPVVAAGSVPEQLVRLWKEVVGEQIICQVELFPIILVKTLMSARFAGRRVVFYIDNDPARDGLISGDSDSVCSRSLLYKFSAAQRACPSFNWFARVPSFSNYSDAPSRGEGRQQAVMLGATFAEDWVVCDSVMTALLDTAR